MALCENCRAELGGTAEDPPAPWFDAATHTIADSHVEPMLWRLFELLWHRRNSGWLSTDRMMRLLYDDRASDPPNDQVVRVFIRKLRQLLGPTPYAIATKWAEGWMIVDRALVEVAKTPVLGEPESGVAPLKRRAGGTPGQDKYGMRGLKAGQSRTVGNATLSALRSSCKEAGKRGLGTFETGFDSTGELRLWRLE